MQKFLVFAPAFDENVGGIICLHRLCHELNQLENVTAALTPYFQNIEINHHEFVRPLARVAKQRLTTLGHFKTRPDLNTPVIPRPRKTSKLDDYVVIYPDLVNGNPLGARNVVRWLLHLPGFHTGRVHYGTGEAYVPFSSAKFCLEIPGSVTLKENLKIVDYPLDIYYPPPTSFPRSGVAYSVRKGWKKSISEHPADAICIDGRGHREIAAIFRKVQTFVSYDSYSAYSLFAAASGCDSVVIPDVGISEEEWYREPADRYGLAYGWGRLDFARETRHLTVEKMVKEQIANTEQVRRFIGNIVDYF